MFVAVLPENDNETLTNGHGLKRACVRVRVCDVRASSTMVNSLNTYHVKPSVRCHVISNVFMIENHYFMAWVLFHHAFCIC